MLDSIPDLVTYLLWLICKIAKYAKLYFSHISQLTQFYLLPLEWKLSASASLSWWFNEKRRHGTHFYTITVKIKQSEWFVAIFLSAEVLMALRVQYEMLLEQGRCQICRVRRACCVFPPCNHMVICSVCGSDRCPECGVKIDVEARFVGKHPGNSVWLLTHSGHNNMVAVLQTTFWDAFLQDPCQTHQQFLFQIPWNRVMLKQLSTLSIR